MTEKSITHSTFAIERTYPASRARVFAAWARAETKNRWMDDPDYVSDGSVTEFDFRVGGHERFGGKAPDGVSYSYDARYYDIVQDHRIIYSYEMYQESARISVSITTVELLSVDGGTTLVLTEQGAYLDGYARPEHREEGIAEQLDNLAVLLRSEGREES
jgi:uncharacterized protein YndB with AHSA1/START domain